MLEQQDYGVFLGDRRMKWHGDPALKIPGWCQFGKSFCFFHRADGVLVGLCKMGFATLSDDDFTQMTPGAVVPGWNLYRPTWAPVAVVENAGRRSLDLRDGDPFDYTRAVRVFPESAKVRAELELTPAQANARLEIAAALKAAGRPLRMLERALAMPVMTDLDARLRLMDRFPGYRQVPCLVSPPLERLALELGLRQLPHGSAERHRLDCWARRARGRRSLQAAHV